MFLFKDTLFNMNCWFNITEFTTMQAKGMKTHFLGKGHNWLYTLNKSSWYSFEVYFKWKKNKSVNIMTLMAMNDTFTVWNFNKEDNILRTYQLQDSNVFNLFTWTCPWLSQKYSIDFWFMNNFYKIGKFINTKFSNNEDTLHVLGAILLDAKTKSRPGPFLFRTLIFENKGNSTVTNIL